MSLTPGTDTYASLAEAEAYMATLIFKDAWASASGDPAKESALKQAGRLLDTLLNWKGTKATGNQSMAWPRVGVFDRDGYAIASDAIPAQIKNAQCEFALRLLAEDRAGDAGGLAPESLKVGSLEITGLKRQVIPPSVTELCRELLKGGGSTRLVRG